MRPYLHSRMRSDLTLLFFWSPSRSIYDCLHGHEDRNLRVLVANDLHVRSVSEVSIASRAGTGNVDEFIHTPMLALVDD